MSGKKTPDVPEIRFEVVKINKIVIELYDRLVVKEPVAETMIHIVHVPNI